MKITTNAHLLNSLTSLIDPNQRQQRDLQNQQQLGQQKDRKAAEAGESARQAERQGRIEANRQVLQKLQDKLKADQLEKLKAEFAVEAEDAAGRGANLNLRESPGTGGRPVDSRPGQIIDIRV